MSCVYVSGDKSATIDFRIPKKLAILLPREHEAVQRSAHAAVGYSSNADAQVWVVALSPMSKAVSRPDEAGPTQATVDTRSLAAGPGSIALTQDPDLRVNAPQFASVSAGAQLMTMIAVSWL
jgi:hypothetical protein